ncbi:MAG: putative manganese-dependent inorganic diphosphatase [Verrucomicrobiota bacterium JB022]|nr:putative manganese-dependent inorganic diphosphatase [Verrucomicrobiota bacterium JB022]
MPKTVHIIGHRNPDADAICSAIGYEAYKHAKGEEHCRAARCGNSNARIDAILKRFHVRLPNFIGDVTPKVQDVMTTEIHKVPVDATCTEALEMIDRYGIRVLPVVDEGNQLKGTLSIFDLGDYFIPKPRQEMRMRHVFTSISDIVRALKAQVVNLVDEDRSEDLFVRVGAMDIRSFGKRYSEDETLARQSVIVVGDRYDIQQRSIMLGMRLLVITGGLPVDDDVVEMAKERGVSIIISPADSATTSWVIRSAGRVDRVMTTDKIESFGPEERLSLVKRKVANSRAVAYMVKDDDERLIGVFSKTDLVKPIETNLILVDHNELSQAVPGADQVNILEVIDHHRLGNPPTQQPILFINRPVGSTSTIVADLFQRDGIEPSPAIAGVLMGGIISDTLNLRGPTTTERDADLLSWLSGIAQTKADDLAELIFNAGSVILSNEPRDVIRSDMKAYSEGEVTYSVSQIEELGFENFLKHREKIEEALEAVCKEDGYYFAALLVTDINTQNSLLLVSGNEPFIDAITYPNRDAHDIFELNGIVSRKKQLIPYLTSLLKAHLGNGEAQPQQPVAQAPEVEA